MLATALNGDPMDALHRIQAAGFTLKLRDTRLVVSPFSQLTDSQRAFIREHKAALIAALASRSSTDREPLTAVEAVDALRRAGFTVSRSGDTLIVEPDDLLSEAQRGFITRLGWAMVQLLEFGTLENLEKLSVQAEPDWVCCATCRHSLLSANTDPVYGWRSCGLDVPHGGGFGQALRRCEMWEQKS